MSQVRRSTRTIVTALSGALLVLGAGGMSMAAPLPASAARAAALPATVAAATRASVTAAEGDINLTVKSARSMNDAVPGLVKKGDAVPTYKWMINADDTGNPGTVSAPLTDQCLPSTAASPGVPVAAAHTDLAATCPWPSIRTTSSHSGIIAQGNQDDLNATTSLKHLPGGKYLISVTAADFKIDGAHFTVDGGTQAVAVEMQPTPFPSRP